MVHNTSCYSPIRMTTYNVEIRKLRTEEYQSLRQTTAWDPINDAQVKTALEKDLFSVCVLDQKKTIGIGRVIGDGAIYFHIQDVIVLPDYQHQGIGKLIMDHIEAYLSKATGPHSFIGLMAADGVKEFYKKYGYTERPPNRPGMYKIRKE